jgi:hypothetical protein
MRKVLSRSSAVLCLLLVVGVICGCATVPKEAVELSYRIGADLKVLHHSYDSMIAQRFDEFRAARKAYLENEWIPIFLNDFIDRGRLIDIAKGEVVRVDRQWVAPTPGQEEAQLLASVRGWSDAAVKRIDKKRAELLEPLDADEKAIRDDLRETFDRLGLANAHITAQMNSIRKVHEVQAQALDELGLKEVVARLDAAVIKISDKAEAGLREIRIEDNLLNETVDIVDGFGDNVNDGN